MPVNFRHVKRQAPEVPTIDGFSGAVQQTASNPAPTSLILGTGTGGSVSAPPLVAGGGTITISSPALPTPTDSSLSSPSPTPTQAAAVKDSAISLSAVVGACVGAFVGLALVICVFIWWTRHNSTKSRQMPRSPIAENRNARGEVDRERTHSGMWNKLDEEHYGGMPPMTRQMTQEEVDEKNFSMFKRTHSTRTTKTTKALEEHGIGLPPIELSEYHPHLAQELAMQSPDKPFAHRQDSGFSWDGETVGDDSFLSLRSVRLDTGAMSPTLGIAKMTPPAQASVLHRWESAEVISMDEPSASSAAQSSLANPFSDHHVERRKSNNNPFFGAGETPIGRRRSRSNSRTRRSLSREPSRTHLHSTAARDTVVSRISEINPFEDIANTVQVAPPPPDQREYSRHSHNDSIASGASGVAFSPSHRAMESLIAALDLTQAEVEDRLRVSMQPTISTAFSSSVYEDDEDIATVRNYPPTPTTPTPHAH